MAKGLDKHKERQAILSSFGKDLTRRAKSRCELCGASGVKLVVHEVAPAPADPDFDHCALLCDSCDSQICQPKKFRPGEHWRMLAETAWSDIPTVQVLAVRLLKRQVDSQPWAREALEELYLDEPIEEWVTKGE